MTSNINIEEVKKYNQSLKEYKDKSARINAQIEFNTKEIENSCRELSEELGIEVTTDNIESIYEEYVEKINESLRVGNSILAKIKDEESGVSNSVVEQVVEQPSQPVQQQMGDIQQAPVQAPENNIQQPVFEI